MSGSSPSSWPPGETGRFSRRQFLGRSGVAVAGLAAGCRGFQPRGGEVIDCHTHFYDPARPQGVPWPGRGETQLYRRVLPPEYQGLARPFGVTGTVVVEASAWFEDNRWLLDLARAEPFIVGVVGNLAPGRDEFAGQIRGLAKDRLFRGLRVSGAAVAGLAETRTWRDLALLADLDLSLDTNGGADSLRAVATVARAVPRLRIIIDHVANVRIDGAAPPTPWQEAMRLAGDQPNVFCKVSGLVEGTGRRQTAPRDLDIYRPVLDHVWQCFGARRVIYGSNWPVSALFADFATVHGLVKSYFVEKGADAARRYFSENARAAYKWSRR